MPALADLTGRTFGRLNVLRRAGTSTNGKATWACRCSCGRETVTIGSELSSGHTASCGCWRAERNRTSSLAHGLHGSATYATWTAMKARCSNPRVRGYADYGGRGVRICDRWRESFENFLGDMGLRPVGTTLDRWPDTNGDYEPSNCRWATKVEQQRNTRANVRVTFAGETLTQIEWANRLGIAQKTLSYRLRHGWTPAEALSNSPNYGRIPRVRDEAGKFASRLGDEVDLP